MSHLKKILNQVQKLQETKYSKKSKFKNLKSQNILIISPHPDDECIQGAIALLLKEKNKCQIINVATTLGSKVKRQKARAKELKKACSYLEFHNVDISNAKSREYELAQLIKKIQPIAIICPHENDLHPTHELSCKILKSAMKQLPKTFKTSIFWTEFWGQLKTANILVEIPSHILLKQMKALEFHEGEIKRNPYHLRLPAWMMDNVRRGSELVQTPGSESAKFLFGCNYHFQKYAGGKFINPSLNNSLLSLNDDLAILL